jgi:hypothetical protein
MIIAHAGWNTPNIILILDSFGYLKGAYTYSDSFFSTKGGNLLLGYEATT